LPDRAERAPAGLRERKKARTREAIRDHAFRLFAEHGYAATTVEQIAEAAEVSPSTFFRYFPSKEEVALTDDLDPLFLAAFAAQPRELGQIAAIRAAIRTVLESTPADVLERDRARQRLILATPELRARMLDQSVAAVALIAGAVAERAGRSADDLAVRAFAGAVVGAALAGLAATLDDPDADVMERTDAVLAQLESGLAL
jgi:AcrR family transcriptional regulator